VKSVLAQAVNRERGGSDPVWTPAFHDRALRKEDDLKAFARYVVANPVRAGLVTRAGDYPFWDAIWLPRS
jgi:REP element-mobilizing transposase RayT